MQGYIIPGILILITVLLNTIAQIFLKVGSGGGLNLYLFGGIILYGFSTIFYIVVLGKLNLSVAYPLIIGLTVMSATVTATIFLDERMTNIQWIGIGLLLSGISAIASKVSL